MTAPRPRIVFVIDDVVLHGIPREQTHAVVDALEAQLVTLASGAAAQGATFSDYTTNLARTSALRAPAGAPRVLGEVLARAVWRSAVEGAGR